MACLVMPHRAWCTQHASTVASLSSEAARPPRLRRRSSARVPMACLVMPRRAWCMQHAAAVVLWPFRTIFVVWMAHFGRWGSVSAVPFTRLDLVSTFNPCRDASPAFLVLLHLCQVALRALRAQRAHMMRARCAHHAHQPDQVDISPTPALRRVSCVLQDPRRPLLDLQSVLRVYQAPSPPSMAAPSATVVHWAISKPTSRPRLASHVPPARQVVMLG
jgi:hypothetical protein